MINPSDIPVEFFKRIQLREANSCLFLFRVTNEGSALAVGLRVWFRAGSQPWQVLDIPDLPPGEQRPEMFGWVAESPGHVAIRVSLGIPLNEGANPPRTVFSAVVSAEVSEAPKTPQSLSQTFHFGEYQVGDVGLSDRAADGRRTKAYRDPAKVEEGWAALELREDNVEARLRQFEQMFGEAERLCMKAKLALDSSDEKSQLLMSAYTQFRDAAHFALDVLRDWTLAEKCLERSREVERLLPDSSIREYERLFKRADDAFSQGRTARIISAEFPEFLKEARKFLREALDGFKTAQDYARNNLGTDRVDACEREIQRVIDEMRRCPDGTTAPVSTAPAANGMFRRTDGTPMEVYVLTTPTVTWGRHSERDVFLALEPWERPPVEWYDSKRRVWNLPPQATEAHRNFVQSTRMSRDHFRTRLSEGRLEIEDRSNEELSGTWLARRSMIMRLPRGQWTALAHSDRIHLANPPGVDKAPVLTLEVVIPGKAEPPETQDDYLTGPGGRVDSKTHIAVVRRVNSNPTRSVLLLAGEALVGTDSSCALIVQGNGVERVHAGLMIDDGALAIHRLGAGVVMINGREIQKKGVAPLTDGAEVHFGAVPFRFKALDLKDPLRS